MRFPQDDEAKNFAEFLSPSHLKKELVSLKQQHKQKTSHHSARKDDSPIAGIQRDDQPPLILGPVEKENPGSGSLFHLTNAASSTECTGLIQVPPETEEELESYNAVYNFAIQQPIIKNS